MPTWTEKRKAREAARAAVKKTPVKKTTAKKVEENVQPETVPTSTPDRNHVKAFLEASTLYTTLGRRKIRYWLSRFRTEELGGCPAEGAPAGLKEYFEGLEWFSKWSSFGTDWDVKEDNAFEIRPLKQSPLEKWNAMASEEAKELPITPTE